MLDAKQVSVSIGGKDIIKQVNLHVANKQFVGLIGPNGCGKSTFLKTLYKVLKPSEGDIIFNDLNVLKTKEKEIAKQLGVITQFHSLPFDFTVYQMVALGRTPHQSTFFRNREQDALIIQEALQKTQLEEMTHHSFLSLSGGEKQRVLLARTLAQEPNFLILDEPTNHLDIRFQVEFLSLVRDLNIGTLAVLHDLEHAATYCDVLYVLKEGKVVAHGTPDDVLTEKLIEEVYGVSCSRYQNPITGKPSFVFQPLTNDKGDNR